MQSVIVVDYIFFKVFVISYLIVIVIDYICMLSAPSLVLAGAAQKSALYINLFSLFLPILNWERIGRYIMNR